MKTFLVIAFMALSNISFAGSSDAKISGVTSSYRTKVELFVSDITGDVRKVTLTVDGESYSFPPSDSIVIQDKENGLYVVIANNDRYQFKMWMVPGSEKTISQSDGSLHTRFAAVIEASDPRKGDKWSMTPRITIGCELEYSI